ncbi:MAG: hypothetical protein LBU27_03590 [Candidatus Peribacteria bacterium]|jgi:hypothetical protein|nr:hypothetical protein [Candidatus Peribacteria bacterium]
MTTLDDEKDDSHLNNKREDLGWEYYGRFDGSSDKLTTDSVSRSLSQPVLLSPQQRNAALSEFVAKH